MWHWSMLLLCLIAALSGTPLRQAEAASDFACSLAELGEDHVEVIDGGVGDDANIAVMKAASESYSFRAMMPLATGEGFLGPLLTAGPSSPGLGCCRPMDGAAMFPAGSGRRHAWIQCFLF